MSSCDISEKLLTFDRHRTLLLSIAYRMLGSVADAEDMVQDTYIRWQQSSSDDIQSPRAFLVTIVTRLCINYLQSARIQREHYVGQWLPEPLINEPGSDPADNVQADEFVSIAFLVLLERLNPTERAVFLLREVFDYEYREVAEILGLNEANCRQILRRARQHLAGGQRRFDTTRSKRQELLERFVRASRLGDLESLIEMIEDDVVLYTDGGGKAFAVPNPIYGAVNVARAIVRGGSKFHPRETVVWRQASVNGAPGVVTYIAGRPLYVLTIDTSEERIRSIYFITNPDKLSHIPSLDEQTRVAAESAG